MQKRWYLAAAAAAVLVSAPAGAQIATPTFQSTARAGNDVGIYLSDGPGDLAVEGIWRRNMGVGDLGLRLGFADIGDGDLLLGVDWRQPLSLGTAPIDLDLTLGAQAALGDVSGAGGQVGLAFGHTFVSPGLKVTPYVHPRVALLSSLGTGAGNDAELKVLADVGADLDFAPNLSLRFGINLGDGADWGIGLAWRR